MRFTKSENTENTLIKRLIDKNQIRGRRLPQVENLSYTEVFHKSGGKKGLWNWLLLRGIGSNNSSVLLDWGTTVSYKAKLYSSCRLTVWTFDLASFFLFFKHRYICIFTAWCWDLLDFSHHRVCEIHLSARAHLYVICAVHHNCPVLLIVYFWSCLSQLFGLVPLPLSCLYVWEQKYKEGGQTWSSR